MKTTIDRAGRVVIPASVRERAGLAAGTELEVTLDEQGVRLTPIVTSPEVVQEGGRWVIRARTKVRAIDVAALVDEERSRWPL